MPPVGHEAAGGTVRLPVTSLKNKFVRILQEFAAAPFEAMDKGDSLFAREPFRRRRGPREYNPFRLT